MSRRRRPCFFRSSFQLRRRLLCFGETDSQRRAFDVARQVLVNGAAFGERGWNKGLRARARKQGGKRGTFIVDLQTLVAGGFLFNARVTALKNRRQESSCDHTFT